MNIGEWVQLFLNQFKAVGWLECAGVGFSVAEVLFARVNKVWLYPTGIISVIITTYIFYHSGLYAESLLNLYYLVMSIYGWWFWVHRRADDPLPITRASAKDWTTTALIVALGYVLLYFMLDRFTKSSVPMFDAWVSATAWTGMWLLAKRKLENWLLLNISNAFAVPLLFYKGLPMYALLTIFLFIIAVQGYFKWKKQVDTRKEPA
ncbi:MAG: nicotinamide riboside transporter PnuC [Niabella sp.]